MPAEGPVGPTLYVIAGVNGAGKSSIAGAQFRARGGDYYDPDEATRAILDRNPSLPPAEANSVAWHEGVRLLRRAIDEHLSFAFETTLGGATIPELLRSAAAAGLAVRIWCVGLEGVELHLARVQARVRRGGHDIPESRIRERYHRSRRNLIDLLPHVTELRLYDNSVEADPFRELGPQPRLILHVRRDIAGLRPVTARVGAIPNWAKPIVLAAVGGALTGRASPRPRA